MNKNTLLRRQISSFINGINLGDDLAIEGICQLLNIKYPLEEQKEQSKINYMIFGKTDKEILTALNFYDKHSEQAVLDDMTFEEAFNKVYQLQKQYSPGLDKAWVKCQLRSWEALGIVKFREDEIERSHTIYRSYNKVVVISETVIKQVSQKLREMCSEVFGTVGTWNNQIAEEFAKIAIEEYERLTNK